MKNRYKVAKKYHEIGIKYFHCSLGNKKEEAKASPNFTMFGQLIFCINNKPGE